MADTGTQASDIPDDVLFRGGFETIPAAVVPFTQKVLERLTYGATVDDALAFEAMADTDADRLSLWLDDQLDPGRIDDSACDQRIAAANLSTLSKSLSQLWFDHVRGPMDSREPIRELRTARHIRAVCSRRQLFERVVEFWHDHFSVDGWESRVRGVMPHYDLAAIRPHALGNFRQMLEAVAKSPAMLYFLDNQSSKGSAFNENFARELLELHTMGVDVYYATTNPNDVPTDEQGLPVGYSDNDVYEAARAFTGWTVADGDREFPNLDTGEFLYWADWHDIANKFFLGEFIPSNQPAMEDGRLVLDRLAAHPATAGHLCRKFCIRFVSDAPPEDLVESAAALFREHWQAPDQIARVLRHILSHPAAFDEASGKFKRPYDLAMGALRKTGCRIDPVNFDNWDPWRRFFSMLSDTGHGPFSWPSPDGFPDADRSWTVSAVLGPTWRLLSHMPQMEDEFDRRLMPILDETLAALSPDDRTTSRIVDYWLERVLGYAPPAHRRKELIDFLRQNSSSDAPLVLDDNPPYGSWNGNDLSRHFTGARLNAMVSLMLTLPEAHQR